MRVEVSKETNKIFVEYNTHHIIPDIEGRDFSDDVNLGNYVKTCCSKISKDYHILTRKGYKRKDNIRYLILKKREKKSRLGFFWR